MPKGVPADLAISPRAFIATLPEPRRNLVRVLHLTVRRAAPGLRPFVRPGRLLYGPWHYRYPSGREGHAAVVAIAPLKGAISLYVHARRGAMQPFPTKTGARLLPEIYGPRLGRVRFAKSVIRINGLDGVDLDTLAEMIREAAAVHGRGAPRPSTGEKTVEPIPAHPIAGEGR